MLEEKIKNLIIEKYGSIRQFAIKIDIPYTTIDSILKRGIDNSNVSNVLKMCKALDISVDKSIENNDLVSNLNFDNGTYMKPIIDDENMVQIPVLGVIKAGIPPHLFHYEIIRWKSTVFLHLNSIRYKLGTIFKKVYKYIDKENKIKKDLGN